MTIRRTPGDFVVTEEMDPAARASVRSQRRAGDRALYLLRKESLTTPEAVARLRAAAGNVGAVSHAGLKDKHAVTSQVVSLVWRARDEPAPLLEGPGWSAAFVGWLGRDVRAADIAGNRFTIVVRDLSAAASAEMDRRAHLLVDGDALAIVNYFGAQRFGSARHGGGFAGAALVRGDFEGALRLLIGTPARKDSGARRTLTRALASRWGEWAALAAELPRSPERRPVEVLASGGTFAQAFEALPAIVREMSVDAFQSHLWNTAARTLARASAGDRALVTADEFGEMVFAPADRLRALAGVHMPMPAPGVEARDAWGGALTRSVAEAGLTMSELRIPGMRRPAFGGVDRALVARAAGFAMSEPTPDDLTPRRLKRTLSFTLPRAAYATVVLRALGQ
ncbi:MAG: tRNA pseudouridine(13) synthase TruD [Planctomycetota bacterium]|nr:tRNA pseudouridine(13) synthase TruD [Planctomycetota bacterium]